MSLRKYVQADPARLREFCTAMGGMRRVSEASGMQGEYIADRLRRRGGTIREDVLMRACEIYKFPSELLLGYGTEAKFHKTLDYTVALKRLADDRKKPKIKTCDSYCKSCIYSWDSGWHTKPICQFILMRFEPRGCPAGKGCTQRVRRGDVRLA